MPNQLSLSRRLAITAIFTLAFLLFLFWEHRHDGVAIHCFLFLEDSPGLSNWWGILIIPGLVWYTLLRIQQEGNRQLTVAGNINYGKALLRFFAALIFGGLLSYFFTIESDLTGYLMLATFALALFVPLHFFEILVGFVVGTVATLGVVIPFLFGLILLLLYWVLYKVGQWVVGFLGRLL